MLGNLYTSAADAGNFQIEQKWSIIFVAAVWRGKNPKKQGVHGNYISGSTASQLLLKTDFIWQKGDFSSSACFNVLSN